MPARRLTEAERATVEANRGLVYVVVNAHYPLDGPDRDDAIQCGCLGLIEAVCGYRSERGPFAPYACECIARRVRDYRFGDRLMRLPKWLRKNTPKAARARLKLKARGSVRLEPVDAAAMAAAQTPDPDWPAEYQDDLARLARALAWLSAESQIVVVDQSRGLSLREIARRMQRSHRWAALKFRRALTRLRLMMGVIEA
jgi:RNA polymerase sigma factor (sigma-70 family)